MSVINVFFFIFRLYNPNACVVLNVFLPLSSASLASPSISSSSHSPIEQPVVHLGLCIRRAETIRNIAGTRRERRYVVRLSGGQPRQVRPRLVEAQSEVYNNRGSATASVNHLTVAGTEMPKWWQPIKESLSPSKHR